MRIRTLPATLGKFCYEFIVGDTPEIAVGVGVLIVIVWLLSSKGAGATFWFLPLAVTALLLGSLWRGSSAS